MRLINEDAVMEIIERVTNEAVEKNQRKYLIQPRIIAEIAGLPTIEAEPVKQDTELSIILQDYGIKDTDALRYILDQYQKIIVDITGGQMSYLTYPAETVIACADDNYCKCHEESMKHGRWEINCDGYYPYCSNCKNEPQGREMTLYCPNCGAKMDGDSDGR